MKIKVRLRGDYGGQNIKFAVAATVLAASLGGLYSAWQEGMIPASIVKPHPRAPLPENFLATLQNSPVIVASLRPACPRINIGTGRDIDRMGRPGLPHQRVPGWDYMVIAAVLSASSSSAGTDSWTANFGKTKFRYAMPKGFKSYDGRQRN